MNFSNRPAISRIIIALIIMVILVFPFYHFSFIWPKYLVAGKIIVDLKYAVCGILFITACCTDFLEIRKSPKKKISKVLTGIADKVLVSGILITLAYDGFMPIIIPVIIITCDIAVDSIKMISDGKEKNHNTSILEKIKTIFMMGGIGMIFFYNLPFVLFNIEFGNYLIVVATILSICYTVQYFMINKDLLLKDK